MNDLALTLVAVLLVLINGFFVAAEFAIVKLRLTRAEELAETGGFVGRTLYNVRHRLDAYLSACQLGITLASLGLGWVGEPAFSRLIAPLLQSFGIDSDELIHHISVVAAFVVISFLHIVVGELAPKSIAIRKAEGVSMAAAMPLFLFYWLMYPFIFVLNGSANLVLRTIRVQIANEGDEPHSADEIKKLLVASHRHGELGRAQAEALSHQLELPELTAGDLMRPAFDLVSLDIRDDIKTNLALIAQHRYSRYAVRDGDQDDRYIGLLHVRDLLAAELDSQPLTSLEPLLREVPMIRRDEPAQALFRRFRRGLPHLALVTDELDTVTGFITQEHILEAIFGSMQDEFHREKEHWEQTGEHTYEGPGWLPIYTLEREIDRDIESDHADTIGGLVMQTLDRLPQAGDRVEVDRLRIDVLEVQGPRIEHLRVTVLQAPDHDPRD
ncbi:hemolysin family protein [Solimonas marina]|uniref:HlyC/CorC family transporter n=1 Tax=Solimonas marina TaxID=2714601 RepID=A0A969W7W6_9GAMM|nr:hemolysin family protein [Solimonas marina]NKF21124.1 HlyC/CorC family transporter [Solimonas marina]